MQTQFLSTLKKIINSSNVQRICYFENIIVYGQLNCSDLQAASAFFMLTALIHYKWTMALGTPLYMELLITEHQSCW